MRVNHKEVFVPRRPGFTLIEILVVVAIIALLISILLPSLQRAREQTKSVVCQSNARQLGMGMTYFTQANRGYYPDADMWLTWTPWYWTGNLKEFTAPKANPGSGRKEGFLLRYVGRSTGVFLCPSDNGFRAFAAPPPGAPDFHAMPPGHTNFAMQYGLQKLVAKPPLKTHNLDPLDPLNNVYFTDPRGASLSGWVRNGLPQSLRVPVPGEENLGARTGKTPRHPAKAASIVDEGIVLVVLHKFETRFDQRQGRCVFQPRVGRYCDLLWGGSGRRSNPKGVVAEPRWGSWRDSRVNPV